MIIEKNCYNWKILFVIIEKIVKIKKLCDDSKMLWWLKNIVIIEKYYDNWKKMQWLKNIVMTEKYYDNGMNSVVI